MVPADEHEPEKVKEKTFEGFVCFLRLPHIKPALLNKLKDMRNESIKTVNPKLKKKCNLKKKILIFLLLK